MGSPLDIALSLTIPAPRHTSRHAYSGPVAWPAGLHATTTLLLVSEQCQARTNLCTI